MIRTAASIRIYNGYLVYFKANTACLLFISIISNKCIRLQSFLRAEKIVETWQVWVKTYTTFKTNSCSGVEKMGAAVRIASKWTLLLIAVLIQVILDL